MILRFFYFAIIAFMAVPAFAIPARRSSFPAKGPDGSIINVRLVGDEYFHYFVNADDESLLMRSDGSFAYAAFDDSLRLRPASDPCKASDFKSLFSKAASIGIQKRNPSLSLPVYPGQRRIPGLVPSATFPAQGSQPVLVILVEYQDVKFNLDNPADYFSRMLNEEGFSDYFATGSARDWFIHSSAGAFSPEFDVYGPVTLQKRREYYGGNDAFGQDFAPQKMAVEACRALNPDVDFSKYDCDGDGYIDNVFIVYAGRGEASGGPADSVWPHAWTLSSAEPGQRYTFDNVVLNRYACSNEWELSDLGNGFRPVGIGTFIHEFSHVMGLPDLYSTKYVDGSFTPGAWSAMDYGPYNNDGCTPPQYSAWERAALGYLMPEPLPDSGNLGIEPLETGVAYIASPSEDADEFFILENRRLSGWDAFIPAAGMLVWHIDYEPEVWRTNSVNNVPGHNYVDIIEADGTCSENSRDGDCFPGASSVSFLDLRLWNGSSLNLSLSDISLFDDRIALRVNGGSDDIPAPQNPAVKEIGPGSVCIAWDPVAGASGYAVSLFLDDEPVESLKTDCCFAEFKDLTPETSYSISLKADDGAFGSIPARIDFQTLPPTIDYLRPTLLPIADLTPNSLLASWVEMPLAEKYCLSIWEISEGERPTISTGFSDGVENLPAGFSTNATSTYGMASYAGQEIPSLRLSADNDWLAYENPRGLRSLSFWHRGNSVGDGESIVVETRPTDDKWVPLVSLPVVSEKGGALLSIDLPDDTEAVRILFNRPEKGSLALDDVEVSLCGDLIETLLPSFPFYVAAPASSASLSGLSPDTRYSLGLTAAADRIFSLPSDKIIFRTPQASAIFSPSAKSDFSLHGRDLSSPIPFSLFSPDGMPIARDVRFCSIPASGLYIVIFSDGIPSKIFVK